MEFDSLVYDACAHIVVHEEDSGSCREGFTVSTLSPIWRRGAGTQDDDDGSCCTGYTVNTPPPIRRKGASIQEDDMNIYMVFDIRQVIGPRAS